MRAGDQLLAVNGESLVGVPQERLVFLCIFQILGSFFLLLFSTRRRKIEQHLKTCFDIVFDVKMVARRRIMFLDSLSTDPFDTWS